MFRLGSRWLNSCHRWPLAANRLSLLISRPRLLRNARSMASLNEIGSTWSVACPSGTLPENGFSDPELREIDGRGVCSSALSPDCPRAPAAPATSHPASSNARSVPRRDSLLCSHLECFVSGEIILPGSCRAGGRRG